jgi:hypothetical protein
MCGDRGAGKSSNLVRKGYDMQVDDDDNHTFTMENVCFTASQFKMALQKDFAPGTVICLDDAGLALFNRDALTRIVKEISKSLMTIRHKNPIIIMSLPFFNMLEVSARMFADLYIEIVDRDYDTNENLVKVSYIKKDYWEGNIWRPTMMKHTNVMHAKFGVAFKTPAKEFYRIKKAPVALWHAYEKYKEQELGKWDKSSLEKVMFEETALTSPIKERNSMGNRIRRTIRSSIELFIGEDKRISWLLIMRQFPNLTKHMACDIASEMNLLYSTPPKK